MSSPKKKPSSKHAANPPSYTATVIKPPAYDPAEAKTAIDKLRPRLMALPADELAIARLDVRAAALAALGVYAFITQAGDLHARFQKLHTIDEFDTRNIHDLKALAFSVLYAHAQAEAAGAFKTDAKVPASLVQEGAEIEARLQELCEYMFKRDETIAPLLALLRPGSGYRDLAGDLNGYADIYDMRPQEVASDVTNYRATDAADARKIAGEILSHLSAAMSPQAKDAYELLQRAWTVLLEVYTEVREVGRCLLRRDPKRDEWFPSLFAAGRAGRPRKKKPEEAKDAGGNENPPANAGGTVPG